MPLIKRILRFIRENWMILMLLVLAIMLRLPNLGYSDYQGDEIKAFFLPEEGQTTSEYLLNQRKGPIQFYITYALKQILPTYSNRFIIRLPFAIAGIVSVILFYEFVRINFGKRVAFYSALFFNTCGFLVAFSRIVQYQSFVIMFMISALYFLSQAANNYKFRITGIYLGLICWALSILSHYDGVFIAPFAFYLLYKWFTNTTYIPLRKKIIHFIISGVIASAMLAAFYIPFIGAITSQTKDYWEGRISGEVSTKISSSKYLFTVYQPIYVVHIYTILTTLGVAYLGLKVASASILRFWQRKIVKYLKINFPFAIKVIDIVFGHKFGRNMLLYITLFIWLLIPFIFLEAYVYIPGTHIYTYLIPMFILLGYGTYVASRMTHFIFKTKRATLINIVAISLVHAFIFLQANAVFVEHNSEYPWVQEKFLLWTLPKPTPIFHLSIFGFPYYRNWDGVGDFVKNHPGYVAYSTNERSSISRYHIPLEKDSDKAGFYVYIKNPQSFTNEVINKKPAWWVENHNPDYTFSINGKEVTYVYIMEPGSLEDLNIDLVNDSGTEQQQKD